MPSETRKKAFRRHLFTAFPKNPDELQTAFGKANLYPLQFEAEGGAGGVEKASRIKVDY